MKLRFLRTFATAALVSAALCAVLPDSGSNRFSVISSAHASGDIKLDLDSDEIDVKKLDKGKYKRRHTRVMEALLPGDVEKARKRLEKWFAVDAKDPENYYMLAVIECQAGNVTKAEEAMRKARTLGLQPERFVAGTHTLLDPIWSRPDFQALQESFANKLASGPMLADVTDSGAKVWVRTAEPAEVQVIASPSDGSGEAGDIESDIVRSTTDSDHTAVVTLNRLAPDSAYHYRVLINGVEDSARSEYQQLTTAPPPGEPAKFSIAFGGCAGYTPKNEHMWDTIRSFKPRAMWLLGDNEYIDQPEMPALQYYCFYRRQARLEFRRLTASTPIYAIWDDHDFGTNDGSGGPDIEKPAWKRNVWNVFRQTWVNPYYAGGPEQPGCWFDYHFGDVHFIFLDGRYYRSTAQHGVDPPTMLGAAQKKWLFETLRASKAKIKVLISPVAWAFETKGESPDTWEGFPQERQQIFDYLTAHQIGGVVLVSSDRHRSDLLKITRPRAYTLHEFNSGLLTNDSVHPTIPTAEFSYNDNPCFGLLSFDTVSPDATVTYRIIDINAQEHLKFEVHESELH